MTDHSREGRGRESLSNTEDSPEYRRHHAKTFIMTYDTKQTKPLKWHWNEILNTSQSHGIDSMITNE